MLVFATGLIAALAASPNGRTPVQEAVGRVFRDPETGKLYVVK